MSIIETIRSIELYKKFINWVVGDFDLYLKTNDSKGLKVYFPNGWFSIGSFIDKEEIVNIEIKVRSRSRIVCDMMMKQIEDRDPNNLHKEINQIITEHIGTIAKLDKTQFTNGLPKTRSGKIMRRILRKIACKNVSNLGDTSTLLNPEVVQDIINNSL